MGAHAAMGVHTGAAARPAAAAGTDKYSVTYFSAKNGMEDGLVNDIIQDRKGLLWFATWSGLYRYDGYDFKNYKSWTDDSESLTNDRLLSVDEDRFGCLWTLCYDYTAYRFNPAKEVFEAVRADGDPPDDFRSISALPGGSVWLLQSGGNALRAQTRPDDLSLSFESYGPSPGSGSAGINHHLLPGRILSVFADSEANEWLLTDCGLYRLHGSVPYAVAGVREPEMPESSEERQGEETAKSSHANQTTQTSVEKPVEKSGEENVPRAFYAATEQDGRALFGADSGRVYAYSLSGGKTDCMRLETSAAVVSIQCSPDGTAYVTDTDGIFVDRREGGMKRFALDKPVDRTVVSARMTGGRFLWLSHPSPGVTLFDLRTCELKHFVGEDETGRPPDTETGFFTVEDRRGVLWVHPRGGGFSRFDTERRQLVPFNTTGHAVKWKSNDRCYTAFADRQGNLWMSAQLDRLKRITFAGERFNIYTPNPADADLPDNEIRALCIDARGRIWTGSRDRNVSVYDSTLTLLHRFHAGRVYAIMQDADGVFWLSTKGDGLLRAVEKAGGGYRLDAFTNAPGDSRSLSSDNVYCVLQDSLGRMWAATYGGGLNLMERQPDGTARFINSSNGLKNYPAERFGKVRHITQDRDGRIWVSTTAGILHFDGSRRPEDIVFHSITRGENGLSNNDVHMVKCTPDGRTYAITYGGGLNELLPDGAGGFRCRPFTQQDGLISDIIYSIQDDRRGGLWLATGGGPVRYVSAGEYIQYPDEHITFNMHFSEGAGAAGRENIYFGTNRGLLYFNPEKTGGENYVPRMFISSVWVDNEELTPGKRLPAIADDVRQIVLPPNNRSLRIVFSALDMTDTEYIKYAFMLEGFDREYRHTDGGREANYTNLPPGKYLFRVKSTNGEGVWLENGKTLPVEVLPSFAETPYADFLILLLILCIILASVYIHTVFYRMKQRIKNEELMAQLKQDFFTDVSHELRTPLTLISGPLEFILRNEPLSENMRNMLGIIKKNSDRMQRLVGQILDFSKIRENKMRLRVQRRDIVAFAGDVAGSFAPLAEERNISLVFRTECRRCDLWFDTDKIEKVLFNLLSNAFTFTPDGKSIQALIEEKEDRVVVKISDQGIGIPEDGRERIFNRFDNLVQKNVHAPASTGIGLSLVKELVELHHGRVSVESAVGRGSVFSFWLPKGKAHYSPDVEYVQDSPPEFREAPDGGEREPLPLMLIVEDNSDLRAFIRQVFQDKFRIVEANDGNDGLNKAYAFVPDIIITDIMMPKKDGLRMLNELKEDERTSHIPAVVLTARSNIECVLGGIRAGADDYIVKPFRVSYLQAKIDNILARMKRMQAYYSSRKTAGDSGGRNGASAGDSASAFAATASASAEDVAGGRNGASAAAPGEDAAGEADIFRLSEKDEDFLSKLNEIIERNMDNAELSVDYIVSNFSLSRTNFFNKLKSLTGLSPIACIKGARMRKAAELIREKRYTMSEIAYMVGYNDPHYFSNSFKAFWGMTCTEYARSQS
jgi:signal transduction histidine kinase/ligand-binding sensor domain-containing protein/DNA-binding NarL/FixJ family response regulator/AraC-like DNA-binding protein